MDAEPPDSRPTLPLVVAVNTGRRATWARLVLAAVFLGLGIAVPTLVAAEWFSGPPAPWKLEVFFLFASLGGCLAFIVGLFWTALRPLRWTIAEDEIVQDGPGRRRRALRWDEVRRVGQANNGLSLHGPPGSGIIPVPLAQLPGPSGIAARAAIEARLSPYFDFPVPPVRTRKQRAQTLAATLLIFAPVPAAAIVPIRLMERKHPLFLVWLRWATELGWFRDSMRRDPRAALVVFAYGLMVPAVLWMLIMGRVLRPWLPPRPRPILPKERPHAPAPGGGSTR